MKNERTGLYRARDGIICGVLKGIADYFNFNVGWLRFIFIVGLLLTGLFPLVFIYFLAALLMKKEPVSDHAPRKKRFSCHHKVKKHFKDGFKGAYHGLNNRVENLEEILKEQDWDRRFRECS